MKKVILNLIYYTLKILLWFRYSIKVEGLENLNDKVLNKAGGVLFLPNHPCVFVDPVVVSLAVWKKYPLRPMMIEYMYYTPIVNKIARLLNALPVPNFDTSMNSLKRKKNDAVFQEVIHGLNDKKENFLIYPSGRTKSTSLEILGGASGCHKVVQASPNANVVLVRTKGLWGSSFSRAFTGLPPPLFPTIWEGVKHVLKNLLFFTPRRKIVITFEPAPADFPFKGTRLEFNKYLEAWYNRPDGMTTQTGAAPGDSLILVPYSMWTKKLPEMPEYKPLPEDFIPLSSIPVNVQEQVIAKLADIADIKPEFIKQQMTLASDLGLDSLDMAELVSFLGEKFDVAGIVVPDLTSVNKLMGYAAKKIATKENTIVHPQVSSKWDVKESKTRAQMAPGETFPEVFLNMTSKMGKRPSVGDDRSGIMTYADLRLRAVLLAEHIRHLPGEYIGILLPSSAGAALLILATQLAGKVPMMINWTVGTRHLEQVSELSKVQVVLTSWAFLDRLENVEFNGIEDKLVMLEDVRHDLGLKQKLQALWRSKKSNQSILKIFGHTGNPDDKAVLLFTSGTESMPKGVPLTHRNILSNIRAATADVDLYVDDVFLAILPPFHSFGFTVSSMLGILCGFRTAFYPNPTDGKGLASAFARWKGTLICGAPTFVRGMLKAAKPEQLKTLRLCVTGAEKAPPDLYHQVESLGHGHYLIEGYGITECSPALTINRPGKPTKGVGMPLSNVELIIVNPDTYKILPVDTQGLILARGPNIFKGYINPGITSPFITVEGKEWYKTGDLGYLDAKNYLVITGRLKRFIKIGGEMISLESIESALIQANQSKKWVVEEQEGPLLAVSAKESEGDKTKLYLFARFNVSAEEVNKALKECGFTNLVKISQVFVLPEIPIMGTGKVNYRSLESQYC